MSKSYFEHYAKQPLLDVVAFERDETTPSLDGIEVEHAPEIMTEDEWQQFVARLRRAGM